MTQPRRCCCLPLQLFGCPGQWYSSPTTPTDPADRLTAGVARARKADTCLSPAIWPEGLSVTEHSSSAVGVTAGHDVAKVG